MNYQNYSALELAMDEYFHRWVMSDDEEVARFWNAWLAQYPHQQSVVAEATQLLLLQQYKNTDHWPAERRKALLERIKHSASVRQEKHPLPRLRYALPFYHRRRFLLAASLSILLLGTIVWLFSRDSFLEYQTGYAEIQEVQLPEGSTVQLNANSSLRFLENWQQSGEREVWLEGEAFFEVSPVASEASEKPVRFTVHVGSLNVEVVGTGFNLNHRAGNVNVFLDHGIIDLRLGDQSRLRLKPGDIVNYSPQTQKLSRKTLNPKTITAWKEHQIILDNQPLSDLAEILQNYYGVTVDFDHPKLADKKVVAILPTDDLDAVLTTMETIGKVRAERKGNYVLFK